MPCHLLYKIETKVLIFTGLNLLLLNSHMVILAQPLVTVIPQMDTLPSFAVLSL